jgi:hypothetical protein
MELAFDRAAAEGALGPGVEAQGTQARQRGGLRVVGEAARRIGDVDPIDAPDRLRRQRGRPPGTDPRVLEGSLIACDDDELDGARSGTQEPVHSERARPGEGRPLASSERSRHGPGHPGGTDAWEHERAREGTFPVLAFRASTQVGRRESAGRSTPAGDDAPVGGAVRVQGGPGHGRTVPDRRHPRLMRLREAVDSRAPVPPRPCGGARVRALRVWIRRLEAVRAGFVGTNLAGGRCCELVPTSGAVGAGIVGTNLAGGRCCGLVPTSGAVGAGFVGTNLARGRRSGLVATRGSPDVPRARVLRVAAARSASLHGMVGWTSRPSREVDT